MVNQGDNMTGLAKEKEYQTLINSVRFPIPLAELCAVAESNEPKLMSGICVRKYTRIYGLKNLLDVQKFGNVIVIFGKINNNENQIKKEN